MLLTDAMVLCKNFMEVDIVGTPWLKARDEQNRCSRSSIVVAARAVTESIFLTNM